MLFLLLIFHIVIVIVIVVVVVVLRCRCRCRYRYRYCHCYCREVYCESICKTCGMKFPAEHYLTLHAAEDHTKVERVGAGGAEAFILYENLKNADYRIQKLSFCFDNMLFFLFFNLF